jgi:predicted secreted protein
MRWYSILAIYLLFWTFTLFLVLPYGVRTSEEEGADPVPGQASGAPHRVSLGAKLVWTTLISALLFVLFYLNWSYGWVDRGDLDRLSRRLFDI